MALLEIRDLAVEFLRGRAVVRVVHDLSLTIEAGEAVCLVGESGSGKSVTALTIARLLPEPPARVSSGTIRVGGVEVLQANRRALRRLRGGLVSYVFQDAAVALHPTRDVGSQILEALRLHQPSRANTGEIVRLMESVGIPAPDLRMTSFPHQLSGGMQQRAMIAMALASRPRLLVADEPTTALDVTVQAQILDLLKHLQQEWGMAILLITHNLGIVSDFADRVAVMYAGQIVEQSPARELVAQPRHPYTRALLGSVPQIGAHRGRLVAIPGAVPDPAARPAGCAFHPRCPIRRPSCEHQPPPLEPVSDHASVRCPWWASPPP